MKYRKIDERTLAIGKKRISLFAPIDEVVEYPDRVVVLLNTYDVLARSDRQNGENVVCYDVNGDLVWRIQNPELRVDDDEDGTLEYCSFLALYLDDKTGELRANTGAVSFVIDKDTGKIIRAESKD